MTKWKLSGEELNLLLEAVSISLGYRSTIDEGYYLLRGLQRKLLDFQNENKISGNATFELSAKTK